MSGDHNVDESKFKGMSRYFNGETLRGRANVCIFSAFLPFLHFINTSFFTLQVAKATYASIGLIVLYFTLKPKSKK